MCLSYNPDHSPKGPPMFTPAVQRIVWKEFRAQRAVWIAIAVELVLLQAGWLRLTREPGFQINLFSLAFVMTGVFAMTSSALLFAGEAEAQTDGFLRQLPFRSKELLLGKLGYCIAAVLAFLLFSVLTTLGVAGPTGQRGGELDANTPLLFANSIFGLWAWGMFYSLVTRKVVRTVIGAAATELVVNGAIHGFLMTYRTNDPAIYFTYWAVTSTVILVDVWLLSRWYAGEAATRPARSLACSALPPVSQFTFPPLPWVRSFKIASGIGIVSGLVWAGLAFAWIRWNILTSGSVLTSSSVLGVLGLFAGVLGTAIVLGAIILWPQLASESVGLPFTRHDTRPPMAFVDSPLTLRRVGEVSGLLAVGLVGLILGVILGFSGAALFLVPLIHPAQGQQRVSASGTLSLLALGSGLALWIGGQWILEPRNSSGLSVPGACPTPSVKRISLHVAGLDTN